MKPQPQVVCLSGPSGSGKSTLARIISKETPGRIVVVSADEYFVHDGRYLFDPQQLGVAHAYCFRRYMDALQEQDGIVVVDNTNTRAIEIAPYALGASAFGFDFQIETVRCLPEHIPILLERNVHGVPENIIAAQVDAIFHRQLPGWWKETIHDFQV